MKAIVWGDRSWEESLTARADAFLAQETDLSELENVQLAFDAARDLLSTFAKESLTIAVAEQNPPVHALLRLVKFLGDIEKRRDELKAQHFQKLRDEQTEWEGHQSDVARLIGMLGGIAHVSFNCRVVERWVSAWIYAGQIPLRRQFQLVKMAEEVGIELPDDFFGSKGPLHRYRGLTRVQKAELSRRELKRLLATTPEGELQRAEMSRQEYFSREQVLRRRELMTDFFQRLGGTKALMNSLGVSREAIRQWKNVGQMPLRTREKIERMARRLDVQIPSELRRYESAKRQERKALDSKRGL